MEYQQISLVRLSLFTISDRDFDPNPQLLRPALHSFLYDGALALTHLQRPHECCRNLRLHVVGVDILTSPPSGVGRNARTGRARRAVAAHTVAP
jgi:hypothetical protein